MQNNTSREQFDQLLRFVSNAQAKDKPTSLDMAAKAMAQQVLKRFLTQPTFHPKLAKIIFLKSNRLLTQAQDKDTWLLDANHPIHSLFEIITEIAIGWDPGQPQSDAIKETIAIWLECLEPGSADKVVEQAHSWLNNTLKRSAQISARAAQAEEGNARREHAKQYASREITRLVANRLLPDVIVEQLQEHWIPSLQLILLNQSEKSDAWKNALAFLKKMLWSVQPQSAMAENLKIFLKTQTELYNQIPEISQSCFSDSAYKTLLKTTLETCHQALLNEQPQELVELPVLEGTSTIDQLNAQISQDLLDEINHLELGQWFAMQPKNLRVQLCRVDQEYKQLLFVNQAGVKALSCSWEEFVYLLSSGDVKPIPAACHLSDIGFEYLNALNEKAEQLKLEKQQVQKRREAQAKAKAEAEKLTEQLSKPVTTGTFEQFDCEAATEASLQQARVVVSSLPVGAWVTFKHDESGNLKRKLAVVLPSSGKYVFVDKFGKPDQEYQRNELIQLVANGDVTIDTDNQSGAMQQLLGTAS